MWHLIDGRAIVYELQCVGKPHIIYKSILQSIICCSDTTGGSMSLSCFPLCWSILMCMHRLTILPFHLHHNILIRVCLNHVDRCQPFLSMYLTPLSDCRSDFASAFTFWSLGDRSTVKSMPCTASASLPEIKMVGTMNRPGAVRLWAVETD